MNFFKFCVQFRSEERNQALRLCGWPHDQEASTLGPMLDKLQMESQVARAAALAVFHMKIRKAIKILTRSGQQKNDVSYQLVALALAGIPISCSDLHLIIIIVIS